MEPDFVIRSCGRTRDVVIENGRDGGPYKRTDATRILPRKHHTEVASRTLIAAMSIGEAARNAGFRVNSVAMDHGPSLNIVTHHMPDWAESDWSTVPPASIPLWKAFWATCQEQKWAFIEAR